MLWIILNQFEVVEKLLDATKPDLWEQIRRLEKEIEEYGI